MLNVNRNINLATPLVRAGGKGPDILPYLNNLKMFIYYSDVATNTLLTGRVIGGNTFISESRWKPYYQDSSTLNASVSGTLYNTLTATSQTSQSQMTRSVGEGVYFTGSLADPPTYTTNQSITSSFQVFISGSSTFNDISSSWTFITYVKPDPLGFIGVHNYGLAQQNLYNYMWTGGNAVKAAGIDWSSGASPNGVITVTTGQNFGGTPSRIRSGSFQIPQGIDTNDGNYHMITVTVNNSTASVYLDNQLTSGSGDIQLPEYGWNNLSNAAQTFKDMKFGSNVAVEQGGINFITNYRAFNGWNKGIAIWDRGFSISDVNTMYEIFKRDSLAPGRNVDINT